MDKRTLILNALQELLREGHAGTASVMDIARKAGIAKGGMYYYFKSKEEALDALAHRQYAQVIEACDQALKGCDADALTKLKMLLYIYRSTAVDSAVDRFLHQSQNAAIHQKSMADIVHGLTPLLADILRQGDAEGVFVCDAPVEFAEIILSFLVFLLDPGLFSWTEAEVRRKLEVFSRYLEKGLSAPQGSLAFLHENWTKQRKTEDNEG